MYTNKFKIKQYKVQELVFSCLRSKIAYEENHIIDFKNKNILLSCNNNICTKINDVINEINNVTPKFYDGQVNKRDSQGFLIYKNNTIYVTFRGTKDINDLFDVIDIRPKKIMKNIYVHTGFLEQFLAIEHSLTNDINEIIHNLPIERIIFTGHSMGGAIAAISAAFYATKFKDIYITCHTFGTSLIGNNDFVEWYNYNVDESKRIEIEDDIVPLIPVNSNFKHIPNGIKLKNNGYIEHSYNPNVMNYTDIIHSILKNKEEVINNHSCDKYINLLLSLKNIKKTQQPESSLFLD